jgi:hypothetical protein
MKFFGKKSFDDYWLDSGPPSFLAKLIAKNPDSFIFSQPLKSSKRSLRAFIPGGVSPIPILFQTGYLTLSGVSWDNEKAPYSLKIPNMEVERGYPKAFYQAYFGEEDTEELILTGEKFQTAVMNGCADAIEKIFEDALSRLSSELRIALEKYYHSIIHTYILALGIDVRSQVSSSKGISDIVLELPKNVYVIIEIKFSPDPNTSELSLTDKSEKARILAQKGLKQIEEKEYSKQYKLKAKKIIEIGLGVFGRSKVVALIRNAKTTS